MPNGDVIKPGVSFLDIRTFFRDDPDWSKVQAYLDGGSAPVFEYHRFWAQSEIAMALADFDTLFAEGSDDTTAPSAPQNSSSVGGVVFFVVVAVLVPTRVTWFCAMLRRISGSRA